MMYHTLFPMTVNAFENSSHTHFVNRSGDSPVGLFVNHESPNNFQVVCDCWLFRYFQAVCTVKPQSQIERRLIHTDGITNIGPTTPTDNRPSANSSVAVVG